MSKVFSIAEARHNLAALVHELEHRPFVQLTRRGKTVAVLLSAREYERLTAPKRSFWEAYAAYASATDLQRLGIEPRLFEAERDRTAGREVSW